MDIRLTAAEAAGALATETLKNVFHRPAANFPGKIGLYVDPHLIADLRSRLGEGSVMVVGTNGKTTVTNLLADAFEAAGKTVSCNRTGANLDSGVATALLHTGHADWGIFECDELWLAKIAPELQPAFVVLLNLFRDQLDRMGEIDHIQAAIVEALASSPSTTLIYNADDPLCQAIADQVGNAHIPFGFDEDLGLAQNTVADTSMCQRCDSLLIYEWHQYGQLGADRCPTCGFQRAQLAYAACDVAIGEDGSAFTVHHGTDELRMYVPFSGTYMLYNALAVCAAADCCGVATSCVDTAISSFAPENGRLQEYAINDKRILLNLAKNPTGFNQNLRIVMQTPGPKAVAFFINDKEADGHDVSWLWDVDFQELAAVDDLVVFAGGIRRNDMQVRLKYAGIDAELIGDAAEFLEKTRSLSNARLFAIANYTALPEVKTVLDQLQSEPEGQRAADQEEPSTTTQHSATQDADGSRDEPTAGGSPAFLPLCDEKLTIVHMYPELLNLYGDGGNVIVLADRARRRGIQTEVVRVSHGQHADLENADIVYLGGGPDREQHLASIDLLEQAQALRTYAEDGGVMLAICGGYQMLGREWLLGDESVPGLGILDVVTKRVEGGSHNRLVGNIILESPLAHHPVVGYENHAGRTYLDAGCKSFGWVVGKHGKGNNDTDGSDGAMRRNVVGTYLHGPLLSKNPEVADWLLERALARRAAKEGRPAPELPPLDDAVEQAANAFMSTRHE